LPRQVSDLPVEGRRLTHANDQTQKKGKPLGTKTAHFFKRTVLGCIKDPDDSLTEAT